MRVHEYVALSFNNENMNDYDLHSFLVLSSFLVVVVHIFSVKTECNVIMNVIALSLRSDCGFASMSHARRRVQSQHEAAGVKLSLGA